MSQDLKVILVAGARPNFMKIAPLISAIKEFNTSINSTNCSNKSKNQINCVLVHTGQHYDVEMSETFFHELELPNPDINLEVGSGTHAVQTANLMIRFEEVCLQEKPDWVVVVGDVNSTMACTLVASKLGIKVAHVEAGLRSFDRSMPEEINRVVTDSLADLLLTPSEDADENLLREGIPAIKIRRVGNIMIDTLVANLDKARLKRTDVRFEVKPKGYVFVTLHRPNNVDHQTSLTSIMGCLVTLSHRIPVVFPVHPRTKKQLMTFGVWQKVEGAKNLRLLAPLGYHDTICLVENSRFVLTDSGGLQEETTFLGIPCLTLRPNTERPITIKKGTNKLTSLERLNADFADLLNGSHPAGSTPELWDGRTAQRIVQVLVE